MASIIKLDSGADFVKVNISNSRNDSVSFEVKIPKAYTVADLKKKLEITTGGSAATMQVELYNNEQLIAKLSDDQQLIGALPIDNGMRLHVIDNFQWITEESVEKFELSTEQYDQRKDTVRDFLKKNQLGKYNEEERQKLEEKRRQEQEVLEKKLAEMTPGSRCRVNVAGHPTRLGTIMYKGPIKNQNKTFIGVKYDLPLGKNDGSVDGERYFECAPKYGGFVLPTAVEVGDFPAEKCELDDDDDEI